MKTTSADVRAALRARFAPPRHALAFEVARTTGHDADRHLDAVAMELWPSRGLTLHGIEVKVSRRDWRRELSDPAKAEEVAQHLDYFWVAAPADVVPVEELPSTWGLIRVADGRARQVVAATRRPDPTPVGRPFLAAMLRATHRGDNDTVEADLTRRRRALDKMFRDEVAAEAALMQPDAAHWREMLGAVGDPPAGAWWTDRDMISVVRCALVVDQAEAGTKDLADRLRAMLAWVEAAPIAPPGRGGG